MGKAKKGFNVQGSKAEAEVFEEVQAGVGDSSDRLRLNQGMNILWVLPGVGDAVSFVTPKKIHYGPFHICGRAGKYRHPDTGKIVDDRDFKKCARCKGASDAWAAVGQPGKGDRDAKDPHKDKFKEDMPTDSALIQVADFTPFFNQKGRGTPSFNEKLADVLPTYIKALGGDEAAIEELPDEKMQESARAGISVVSVNNELMNSLIDANQDTRDTFEVRAENDETLRQYVDDGIDRIPLHPEAFLINIERGVDKSKSFTGRDGTEKHAYTNKVSYLTYDNLVVGKGTTWASALPKDDLLDVAIEQAVDLVSPQDDLPADADLTTKARAFVTLTADEMLGYLKESAHSFTAGAGPAEGGSEQSGSSGSGGSGITLSPDNFDAEGAADVVASAAKRDALKQARAAVDADEDED